MNRTERRDATEPDDPITERAAEPMRDVSHTHPHAARGTVNRPFERGPVVAADGGERNAVPRTSEDERSESSGSKREAYDPEGEVDEENEAADRMKDVSHTPPHDDGESADRVFERGGEYRAVESEE
ncbi:hypothetical protein [Halorussus sp. AFM4]|uniref:hypothetical protein n=1 Tax=Halorussus sp. AFM4 TaxID=3421651 RepID=UPI003EBA32E8